MVLPRLLRRQGDLLYRLQDDQEPYAFMRSSAGTIGLKHQTKERTVCECQLHFDAQDRPLRWNGGLIRNKDSNNQRPLQFDYWMHGGGHQKHREYFVEHPDSVQELLERKGVESLGELEVEEEDPEWNIKTSCLTGGEVKELEGRQKEMAVAHRRVYNIAKEDQLKPLRLGHDWLAIAEGWATSEAEKSVKHGWDRFLNVTRAEAKDVPDEEDK